MPKAKKTTKSGEVRKHLHTRKSITSWQAIEKYGATRISAIIYNLRAEGYVIESQPTAEKDRNGNTCNFVTYRLISRPKKEKK